MPEMLRFIDSSAMMEISKNLQEWAHLGLEAVGAELLTWTVLFRSFLSLSRARLTSLGRARLALFTATPRLCDCTSVKSSSITWASRAADVNLDQRAKSTSGRARSIPIQTACAVCGGSTASHPRVGGVRKHVWCEAEQRPYATVASAMV